MKKNRRRFGGKPLRLDVLDVDDDGGKDAKEETMLPSSGAVHLRSSKDGGVMDIDESGVHFQGRTMDRIGKYDLRIGRALGAGASGQVFIAEHNITGERYALKMINIADRIKRRQTFDEINLLFQTDTECDALVQMFGAFYQEAQVGIVLEFMDHGDLKGCIPRGGMPERVLAGVAFQVLWGLAYLDFENRFHRDIKPENILVNSMGHIKITDFGIARQADENGMAKTQVGTWKYMAPERLEGDWYDARSDIWSLGIVILECAKGEYPFPEIDGPLDIVQEISSNDTMGLSGFVNPEGFAETFLEFVVACIHKDPRVRIPANILLQCPWLVDNGFDNSEDGFDAAVECVRRWLADNEEEGAF